MKIFFLIIFFLNTYRVVAQNDSALTLVSDQSIVYSDKFLYQKYPNSLVIDTFDSIISIHADNGKFKGKYFFPKKKGITNFTFHLFKNGQRFTKIRTMESLPYPKLHFKILEIKADSMLYFQILEKHSKENWTNRLLLSYGELKIYDENNSFLGDFIIKLTKSDTSYMQITVRQLSQNNRKIIPKLKKGYKIKIVYLKILDKKRNMLVIMKKNQFSY